MKRKIKKWIYIIHKNVKKGEVYNMKALYFNEFGDSSVL